MRKLFISLVGFALCGLSASGQDDPNQAPKPKPEVYNVEIQFFKGNPTGSISKGDVKRVGSFNALSTGSEGGIGFSNFNAIQQKAVYEKGIFFRIEYAAENCFEVEVQTKLSVPTEDKTGLKLVTNKHTQQVQPGGTIRVRMSPEDKNNETWAEIKIEKAK